HTITERDSEGATTVRLDFQHRNRRVPLKIDAKNAERGIAPDVGKDLQALFADIKNNRELKELMKDTGVFSDRAVLVGAMSAKASSYALVDSLPCIIAAGECVLIIAAYVGSIGSL